MGFKNGSKWRNDKKYITTRKHMRLKTIKQIQIVTKWYQNHSVSHSASEAKAINVIRQYNRFCIFDSDKRTNYIHFLFPMRVLSVSNTEFVCMICSTNYFSQPHCIAKFHLD